MASERGMFSGGSISITSDEVSLNGFTIAAGTSARTFQREAIEWDIGQLKDRLELMKIDNNGKVAVFNGCRRHF